MTMRRSDSQARARLYLHVSRTKYTLSPVWADHTQGALGATWLFIREKAPGHHLTRLRHCSTRHLYALACFPICRVHAMISSDRARLHARPKPLEHSSNSKSHRVGSCFWLLTFLVWLVHSSSLQLDSVDHYRRNVLISPRPLAHLHNLLVV